MRTIAALLLFASVAHGEGVVVKIGDVPTVPFEWQPKRPTVAMVPMPPPRLPPQPPPVYVVPRSVPYQPPVCIGGT